MAEVYRAKDTRLGREVAIKVVSEALGADGAVLERFERESKLAASLAHPNVVALHDVGLYDGKPYFVTELLQGETLRERLAKGPIPTSTALDWAAQMAKGLAAAHEKGIVHRDLKPENVFITRDGHVKLLDFGIAKLLEAKQAATSHDLLAETVSPSGGSTGTGMVLGTPGYMSPEQVSGNAVDARTDFFSLGAVLYEMLCGHRAFPAGSVVESGYAIVHHEPAPLPALVPPLAGQVVQRCLEKDPGLRFQSARDLAFNLELLRSSTGPTPTSTTPRGTQRPSGRARWLWPLGATMAALGLGAAMFIVGREQRPPIPAVEQITSRLGRVTTGRFTPEGRVIFSAAWGSEPTELFAWPRGAVDAQSLGLRNVRLLAVSPDGDLALLLRETYLGCCNRYLGTLAVVPAAGGAPRELAENIKFADFTPSGELVVVRREGEKSQLEWPMGKPVFESNGAIEFPRVSPRGDLVAFQHLHGGFGANSREVSVVDRQGRVRVLSAVPNSSLAGLAWSPRGDEVWFTTNDAIWASPLSGGRRLVYQGVSEMYLEDISKSGEVLVNREDTRGLIGFVPRASQRERQLSWLDGTFLGGLSEDGRYVLVRVVTGMTGKRFRYVYVRPTDGSPPLKLGPGIALALSSDAKWVLAISGDENALVVLPVGVGRSKMVSVPGLEVARAQWLRDGTRVLLLARRGEDKHLGLYLSRVEGGAPALVSDAALGLGRLELSRDDRFAAASDLAGILTLYPLDGGSPVPLPGLGRGAEPITWAADGGLWIRRPETEVTRIVRYDVRTGEALEERTISPADATGVSGIDSIYLTPDGRDMALGYDKYLGGLYLLNGLAPGRL
jgi:tRNA A-37 threonylcarbamoyl transferase component Bud32